MPVSEHQNPELKKAYAERPFQGAEPESARFMFIGLDANYPENIQNFPLPIFPQLLEYLKDGVRFWKTNVHKVHHPFLLPECPQGAGRIYHEEFARIGFTPQYAGDVSFVELFHLPTVPIPGQQNHSEINQLNPEHLRRLNEDILCGCWQFIFISKGVALLMKGSGYFPWLPNNPTDEGGPLKIWIRLKKSKIVYCHYHFSVNRPQFMDEKKRQLQAIADIAGLEHVVV